MTSHIKKVYIASCFKLANKCSILSDILKQHGINTPVKWWNDKRVEEENLKHLNDEDFYFHPITEELFYKDVIGIYKCDLFIILSDEFIPLNFNGANIELGIAFGFDKIICGIGKFDKSVMYHPMTLYKNIPDFIADLDYKAFRL